jgi:UMF1 family MFS transporter
MDRATGSGQCMEKIGQHAALAQYPATTQHLPLPRRVVPSFRWYDLPSVAALMLTIDLGFTTLTSTALLFAKTTLHMPPSSLVLVGVLTPSAGILGALVWPIVQRRLGLSSLRVLILLVSAASAIPLYGVFGLFAPRGAKWGLRVPAEMYVIAVYFGALYGAFQSYARALYAEIIPPGEEARWYGLFSITDKVRCVPVPW